MEIYIKECPFDKSQEPVAWSHMGCSGAIPAKCDGCKYFFEGSCKKIKNRLLRLDYGFCGIEGSKKLVEHPKVFRKIPEKCIVCEFLKEDKILKLVCVKDPNIWGNFSRGLDY